MKKFLLICFFSLFTILSCQKKENEINFDRNNINKEETTIEPRYFTIGELQNLITIDSVNYLKKMKQYGFVSNDFSTKTLVLTDSAYLNKTKNIEIGFGYYLLLKAPVITRVDELKQISITFPSNQFSKYLRAVNELTSDGRFYKISNSNVYYEAKDALVPSINFTPLSYSHNLPSYSMKIYEDYGTLKIELR